MHNSELLRLMVAAVDAGNMMMGVKGEPYHVPPKGVTVDHSSDEQPV